MTPSAFPNFRPFELDVGEARIAGVIGGEGPPVLLLHGYPETSLAWRHIAPVLAQYHTVVATDLRGYGDSVGPVGASPEAYSKRVMAQDQIAVMAHLGFKRFAVVGHDRGARVGYRMALDAPHAVSCFTSLTVIPTADMWRKADRAFGLAAYHWFLLAQPYDMPERLIGADPDFFLEVTLQRMALSPSAYADALEPYAQAFRKAEVRHAMCQDYRAGASIDLTHDQVDLSDGRKLRCPVLVLWPEHNAPAVPPLDTWRPWVGAPVFGRPLPGCGHLLPEEAPDAVLADLVPFLSDAGA
ncbi:alpha/beta fold hydrolase [Phreatobacter sp. AB_2022a]|uniref:alpha/beta fold hydrolase n=1 Tax=Phreatobacter sp. AB_2022a TaxID=3003134 RepID=UPI0022871039|nr:alpha/beta hydrolase [Phreatobacter sp. AB_2022a]MCZ0736398.1 alpha/beta hydrolase [Phreatobacter sp. AB_2022a]